MTNCLICNEPTVILLNLSDYPNFYKKQNTIIYNGTNISFTFNYCYKCFHCQLNNISQQTTSNDTTSQNTITITNNTHTMSQKQIFQDFSYTNALYVTEYNFKIPNSDQILIENFLDIHDNSDKYNKIIFYKSFDKTRDLKNILQKCKKLLLTTGEIIIVTSTENVIKDKKFEHINSNIISYFSINSMKTLCDQFNLTIYNIKKSPNYSIYHIGFKTHEIGSSNDVIQNLYADIESDMYNDKTYIMFNLKALLFKSSLQKKLTQTNISRFQNETPRHLVIGYGLEESSINWINLCNLTNEYIDYFISFDLTSNILVPGTNIEIKNYWDLFTVNLLNDNTYICNITLVNFDRKRINDRIIEWFEILYSGNINIVDVKNEIY